MLKKFSLSILFGVVSVLFSPITLAEETKGSDLLSTLESTLNKPHEDIKYESIDIKSGKLIKIDENVRNELKLIGGNASGFKTGKNFAEANISPIMIFFDTRCPYCKTLWNSSMTAENSNVSVYWIPVSVIDNYNSLNEGALLLDNQSSPYALMEEFTNKSNDKISLSQTIHPSEQSVDKIMKNTLLFHSLKFNSVPLLLKITKNGELYVQYGDINSSRFNEISKY